MFLSSPVLSHTLARMPKGCAVPFHLVASHPQQGNEQWEARFPPRAVVFVLRVEPFCHWNKVGLSLTVHRSE